jgi:hypothetical protein
MEEPQKGSKKAQTKEIEPMQASAGQWKLFG